MSHLRRIKETPVNVTAQGHKPTKGLKSTHKIIERFLFPTPRHHTSRARGVTVHHDRKSCKTQSLLERVSREIQDNREDKNKIIRGNLASDTGSYSKQ